MADEQNNGIADKAKQKVKQKAKRTIKRKAILITAYVLTIVMVAGFVWGLFTLLIDLIKGIWKEAKGYFILEGTGIVIDDETVDNLILAIEATGIDLEDLELLGDIDYKAEDMEAEIQEAKRKYIKMFYRAQVISQELKRGDDGLQGHVYLNPENQYASNLRYMRYDVTGEDDNAICFRDLIESNSPNAKNFYSVTPEGQLVVASVEETTMQTNVDTDGNLKDDNETKKTYKVEEIPIDYQSMISQYSTPMAFFLELGMVTRNPNFLEAVAKMVEENTDIQLTILNTVTTEVTTEEATYTEHILERRVFEDGTGKLHYRDVETEVTKTETTTKTVVTTVPTVKVTSVDTWICRQKITYTKQEGTPEEKEEQLIKQESDEPKHLSSDKTKPQKVTWITREDIKVTGSIKVDTYDDGVPSDYEYRAGENPDKDPTYVSFVDLMDVKFRIPNSKEKRTAATYLTTDVEWFYTLLRQSPETQGMEQIMRYIMHQYDPKKFPAVELDFGVFDPNYFSAVSGGSGYLKSFIREFEGTKEEGGKYVVYLDSAGNRTVGYGVNIEAQGARLVAKGINPAGIKAGDKLDKEIIDSIEDEIMSEYRNGVVASTSGLNLKPYQIDALTSRKYNCGNINGFVAAYQKYWKELDDEYGVAENPKMYQHPLYTNYMSKPIRDNKGNTLNGLVKRRKQEWILFKTGYYPSMNGYYPEGGKIIEWAKVIHEYMEKNKYTYCVYGGNSYEECGKTGQKHGLNTTFEQSKTGYHHSCCATYVSWVLQEAGYLSDSEHQDGANNLASLLKRKGFTVINNKSEIKEGDILCYNRHIEIYAGDGKVYNAGSGPAIRNASPYKSGVSSCQYALRAPK